MPASNTISHLQDPSTGLLRLPGPSIPRRDRNTSPSPPPPPPPRRPTHEPDQNAAGGVLAVSDDEAVPARASSTPETSRMEKCEFLGGAEVPNSQPNAQSPNGTDNSTSNGVLAMSDEKVAPAHGTSSSEASRMEQCEFNGDEKAPSSQPRASSEDSGASKMENCEFLGSREEKHAEQPPVSLPSRQPAQTASGTTSMEKCEFLGTTSRPPATEVKKRAREPPKSASTAQNSSLRAAPTQEAQATPAPSQKAKAARLVQASA